MIDACATCNLIQLIDEPERSSSHLQALRVAPLRPLPLPSADDAEPIIEYASSPSGKIPRRRQLLPVRICPPCQVGRPPTCSPAGRTAPARKWRPSTPLAWSRRSPSSETTRRRGRRPRQRQLYMVRSPPSEGAVLSGPFGGHSIPFHSIPLIRPLIHSIPFPSISILRPIPSIPFHP